MLESDVDGECLVADDPACRLYDAHRQSELVRAQLRDPPFCPAHAEQYG